MVQTVIISTGPPNIGSEDDNNPHIFPDRRRPGMPLTLDRLTAGHFRDRFNLEMAVRRVEIDLLGDDRWRIVHS